MPDTVALNRLYSGTECAESVLGRQAPPWWHRLGGFLGRVCFRGILLSDAVDEAGDWGTAVHAAALMRSFGIVFDKVLIENGLHLLEGLKPGAASLDAKILVEEGAEYYWIAAD